MIELTLPLPPSTNNLYFNSPHGGRVPTKRYAGWRNVAGTELKIQKPGKVDGDYVLWIWCERPDKRKRDLGNLEKPLSDLLVEHGVVGDDSQCTSLHMYWSGSGRHCRVQVKPA